MLRFILGFCLLLPALPAAAQEVTFSLDGHERRFELTVPDGLDGPAPLVLVIHGIFSSDTSMRRVSQQRFDAFAARYHFIVAYPDALLAFWNVGEGPGSADILPRRDDVAYLERVIDEVRARAPVDRRRIFATGFSQGGMMSFALACKHPGLIRAVASLSMPLPELLADDCAAHPPRGVLLLHGTTDRVVPFEGGTVISGPKGTRMRLMSHEASVRFFARRLGCGAPDGPVRIYDAKDDGTRVLRTTWTHCAPGRAVEDYRVEGAGHAWPHGSGVLPLVENGTREVDGAAVAWGFFSRFR